MNRPNQSDSTLKPEQFAWWVDVMKQQKLLQGSPDLAKLVLK
jgi:hypothetical protein